MLGSRRSSGTDTGSGLGGSEPKKRLRVAASPWLESLMRREEGQRRSKMDHPVKVISKLVPEVLLKCFFVEINIETTRSTGETAHSTSLF